MNTPILSTVKAILLSIATIIFLIQTESCKRSGFDHAPKVELPPSPQPLRLKKKEKRAFDQQILEVLSSCDEDPPSWIEARRAQKIQSHPELPRLHSIFDRLLLQSHDSRKSWQIFVYDDLGQATPNLVACPGNYLFLNTSFFAAKESDEKIAIQLGHALGHVYSNHPCWSPMGAGGRVIFQRDLDSVPIELCRIPIRRAEDLRWEFDPTLPQTPAHDWPEEIVLDLFIWPILLFGDSGTIQHEARELQASVIGLYLMKHAGFDVKKGMGEYSEPDERLVCGGRTTMKSFPFALKYLSE